MSKQEVVQYATLELAGLRYAVISEAKLQEVCRLAGLKCQDIQAGEVSAIEALEASGATMAQRIRQRRRAAGLTQAVLASRAGIRTETLNRIERGKTEPDFRTVRKLVVALKAAEAEQI